MVMCISDVSIKKTFLQRTGLIYDVKVQSYLHFHT